MTHNPFRFLTGLWSHLHMTYRGKHVAYFDYPALHAARYGWGRPPHRQLDQLLGGCHGTYDHLLERLAGCADELRRIPVEEADPVGPYWMNGFIQDLDAATLYAFPKIFGSKRYVEIGSGNSTKFVRRSRDDYDLTLTIVSIDPAPRAEIDSCCDRLHRGPLQTAPLDIFDSLDANDILMVDGSHRCFQNSDVTVVFLDVLPRLRPGVLVYFDDIFLPRDYPPEWKERHYSEQYLLAVLLLADRQRRYEVLFPGNFSYTDPHLRALTDRFWADLSIPGLSRQPPNGFWLRVAREHGTGSRG